MRKRITAATALAGSLLLAPLMLGPTQAGSAPDLKNAVSAIHDSAVTLVRGGGGWWRLEAATAAVDSVAEGAAIWVAVDLVAAVPPSAAI